MRRLVETHTDLELFLLLLVLEGSYGFLYHDAPGARREATQEALARGWTFRRWNRAGALLDLDPGLPSVWKGQDLPGGGVHYNAQGFQVQPPPPPPEAILRAFWEAMDPRKVGTRGMLQGLGPLECEGPEAQEEEPWPWEPPWA